ncbi:hypothetical protein SAMN05444000_11741 [Shimia gijangensis]|uniref:Regulatory protein SoxS n=1 Tax=Shimia gijangensis TaxID=1470563 RepID=A0A1M6P1Y7_9RHOB|nr:hypothetical protein [Shimia gijangensis]SHK01989.1 hypothetical protein SAMN05444000_11741 [Shimia gijangensis]
MKFHRFLFGAAFALLPALPVWAVELVMVEQPGCYTCKQWNAEIGPIYPRTEAGELAPLRREQLHERPDDLTYARAVNYTPTFILIDEGQEIARLEGYPGEDFFWWHIENMLIKHAAFDGATK